MECLKELIGITRSACPCITQGLTDQQKADLALSKSGKYLDENVEGGLDFNAIKGSTCKTFYDKAISARNYAATAVRDDLLEAMNTRYTKNKDAFTGNIGERSYATTLAATMRYQGMAVEANGVTDSVLKVMRLELIVNMAASLVVRVVRAVTGKPYGEEVAAFPVTTNANLFTAVNIGTGLTLPLKVNGQPVTYFFYWDPSDSGVSVQPKDNKIDCGCDKGGNKLYNFVKTYGFQSADMTLNAVAKDEFSRGIILTADVRCSTDEVVCEQFRDDDPIAAALAGAMLFKTEIKLIDDILASGEVNRYTLMNTEFLYGKRNHFRTKYEHRIAWLAKSIDVSASDCFLCRPKANMPVVKTILS